MCPSAEERKPAVSRMVRFARIKGAHKKSSFNKVPEEASTWEELRTPSSGAGEEPEPENSEGVSPTRSLPKKVDGTWSEFEPETQVSNKKKKKKKRKLNDFEPLTETPEEKKSKIRETDGSLLNPPADPRTHDEDVKKRENATNPVKKTRKQKELEGLDFKRKKPANDEVVFYIDGKEVKLEKFDGYLVAEERAKRLHEMRHKLREEGKDEKDIFGLIKSERRKAEKELKTMKKRLCFHCRKGGHNLSDCPELGNRPEQGSGICFKCGSTEHMLFQCKSKSNTLEYATCFICNEKGHLSRNCTNNPRGLYPDGGGCKTCGDVTHYERDCPKKRKHKEVVSAKRIDSNDVEALDYDDEVVSNKRPLKIDVGKRPNKIIKF